VKVLNQHEQVIVCVRDRHVLAVMCHAMYVM
jgi:hypothetical protein